MLQSSVNLASVFNPVMLQLRFVGACSLLGLVGWSSIAFLLDIIATAKKMHRIPCTKCQFFTGDYRLKCTINPHIANTEEAIGCSDCRSVEHY